MKWLKFSKYAVWSIFLLMGHNSQAHETLVYRWADYKIEIKWDPSAPSPAEMVKGFAVFQGEQGPVYQTDLFWVRHDSDRIDIFDRNPFFGELNIFLSPRPQDGQQPEIQIYDRLGIGVGRDSLKRVFVCKRPLGLQ